MADPETFKDRFRDIQKLVRKLFVLRAHNLKFKESDSQTTLLLFAEASLTIIILEHFVRLHFALVGFERVFDAANGLGFIGLTFLQQLLHTLRIHNLFS